MLRIKAARCRERRRAASEMLQHLGKRELGAVCVSESELPTGCH